MKIRCFIFLLCMQVLLAMHTVAYARDYIARDEVQTYIDELVAQHSFDRAYLTDLLADVKRQGVVIRVMDDQPEAKPWYEYRKIFFDDARISQGVTFWESHAQVLARVEREYQVPAPIVLAIAGVETYYGRNLGRTPALDALVTLGFDYPRRSSFFRNELTEMLLLGREEGLDLAKIKGSVSGAVGFSQFMPSSYRYYAVDFDGDGKRNLWQTPDALASIANYLARHGWKYGGTIANRVELTGTPENWPLNKGLKPWLSRSDIQNYGIASISGLAEDEPLFSIAAFEIKDGVYEYWATYHNFYVISRYNHSRRYSMAVYQISKLMQRRYFGEDEG